MHTGRRRCCIDCRQCHLSVTQVVTGYRIPEGQDLLSTSDLQITEIAFRVGFNSLATFNRAFKTATGTTPRASRRHRAVSAA